MDAAYPPFGSRDSATGQYVGFDVDVIRAIGKAEGFNVEVRNIAFDGLIPALKTGNIDIAINDITITPERAKSVDFSDRYYIAGLGVVARVVGDDLRTVDAASSGRHRDRIPLLHDLGRRRERAGCQRSRQYRSFHCLRGCIITTKVQKS